MPYGDITDCNIIILRAELYTPIPVSSSCQGLIKSLELTVNVNYRRDRFQKTLWICQGPYALS